MMEIFAIGLAFFALALGVVLISVFLDAVDDK